MTEDDEDRIMIENINHMGYEPPSPQMRLRVEAALGVMTPLWRRASPARRELMQMQTHRALLAADAAPTAANPLKVMDEIAAERRRQIADKGWTLEHDDEHTGGELLTAGWGAISRIHCPNRSSLIEAAALIVAEIERCDRAAAR